MDNSFTIPKKNYASSKHGSRYPVDSRERFDFRTIVEQSCIDKKSIHRYWQERSTTSVRQPTRSSTFTHKKEELGKHLPRQPTATYAFGLVKSDELADEVCQKDAYERQEFHEFPLGAMDQGVNLFLSADLLLEWARKKRYRRPSLIIYKIIKGRCKIIPSRTDANGKLFEPTPNYDCHVLKASPVSDDLKEQIVQSQIFLYEYDDALEPAKNPRHCFPCAVINFKRDESVPPRTNSRPISGARVPSTNGTPPETVSQKQCQAKQTNDSCQKTAASREHNAIAALNKRPTLSGIYIELSSDDEETGRSDFIDIGELSDPEGNDADTEDCTPRLSSVGQSSFQDLCNGLDDGSDVMFSSDEESTTSPYSHGYHSSPDGCNSDLESQSVPTYNAVAENDSDTTSMSDLTSSDEETDNPSVASNYVVINEMNFGLNVNHSEVVTADTSINTNDRHSKLSNDKSICYNASSAKLVSNSTSTSSNASSDKMCNSCPNANHQRLPKTPNVIPSKIVRGELRPSVSSVQTNDIRTRPKKLSPPDGQRSATSKKLSPLDSQSVITQKTYSPPAPAFVKRRRLVEAKRKQQKELDSEKDDENLQKVKKLKKDIDKKLTELKLKNLPARLKASVSPETPGPSVKPTSRENSENVTQKPSQETETTNSNSSVAVDGNLQSQVKKLETQRLEIRVPKIHIKYTAYEVDNGSVTTNTNTDITGSENMTQTSNQTKRRSSLPMGNETSGFTKPGPSKRLPPSDTSRESTNIKAKKSAEKKVSKTNNNNASTAKTLKTGAFRENTKTIPAKKSAKKKVSKSNKPSTSKELLKSDTCRQTAEVTGGMKSAKKSRDKERETNEKHTETNVLTAKGNDVPDNTVAAKGHEKPTASESEDKPSGLRTKDLEKASSPPNIKDITKPKFCDTFEAKEPEKSAHISDEPNPVIMPKECGKEPFVEPVKNTPSSSAPSSRNENVTSSVSTLKPIHKSAIDSLKGERKKTSSSTKQVRAKHCNATVANISQEEGKKASTSRSKVLLKSGTCRQLSEVTAGKKRAKKEVQKSRDKEREKNEKHNVTNILTSKGHDVPDNTVTAKRHEQPTASENEDKPSGLRMKDRERVSSRPNVKDIAKTKSCDTFEAKAPEKSAHISDEPKPVNIPKECGKEPFVEPIKKAPSSSAPSWSRNTNENVTSSVATLKPIHKSAIDSLKGERKKTSSSTKQVRAKHCNATVANESQEGGEKASTSRALKRLKSGKTASNNEDEKAAPPKRPKLRNSTTANGSQNYDQLVTERDKSVNSKTPSDVEQNKAKMKPTGADHAEARTKVVKKLSRNVNEKSSLILSQSAGALKGGLQGKSSGGLQVTNLSSIGTEMASNNSSKEHTLGSTSPSKNSSNSDSDKKNGRKGYKKKLVKRFAEQGHRRDERESINTRASSSQSKHAKVDKRGGIQTENILETEDEYSNYRRHLEQRFGNDRGRDILQNVLPRKANHGNYHASSDVAQSSHVKTSVFDYNHGEPSDVSADDTCTSERAMSPRNRAPMFSALFPKPYQQPIILPERVDEQLTLHEQRCFGDPTPHDMATMPDDAHAQAPPLQQDLTVGLQGDHSLYSINSLSAPAQQQFKPLPLDTTHDDLSDHIPHVMAPFPDTAYLHIPPLPQNFTTEDLCDNRPQNIESTQGAAADPQVSFLSTALSNLHSSSQERYVVPDISSEQITTLTPILFKGQRTETPDGNSHFDCQVNQSLEFRPTLPPETGPSVPPLPPERERFIDQQPFLRDQPTLSDQLLLPDQPPLPDGPPPLKPLLPYASGDDNLCVVDMDVDLDSSVDLVVDYDHMTKAASSKHVLCIPEEPTGLRLEEAGEPKGLYSRQHVGDNINNQRVVKGPTTKAMERGKDEIRTRLQALREELSRIESQALLAPDPAPSVPSFSSGKGPHDHHPSLSDKPTLSDELPSLKQRLPSASQNDNVSVVDTYVGSDSSGGLVVEYSHKTKSSASSNVTLGTSVDPERLRLGDATEPKRVQSRYHVNNINADTRFAKAIEAKVMKSIEADVKRGNGVRNIMPEHWTGIRPLMPEHRTSKRPLMPEHRTCKRPFMPERRTSTRPLMPEHRSRVRRGHREDRYRSEENRYRYSQPRRSVERDRSPSFDECDFRNSYHRSSKRDLQSHKSPPRSRNKSRRIPSADQNFNDHYRNERYYDHSRGSLRTDNSYRESRVRRGSPYYNHRKRYDW